MLVASKKVVFEAFHHPNDGSDKCGQVGTSTRFRFRKEVELLVHLNGGPLARMAGPFGRVDDHINDVPGDRHCRRRRRGGGIQNMDGAGCLPDEKIVVKPSILHNSLGPDSGFPGDQVTSLKRGGVPSNPLQIRPLVHRAP